MREQMMLDGFLPHDTDEYRMRLLLAEVKMAQTRLERAQDDLAKAQHTRRSQVTMSQWLSARDDVRGSAAKFG